MMGLVGGSYLGGGWRRTQRRDTVVAPATGYGRHFGGMSPRVREASGCEASGCAVCGSGVSRR